MSPDSSRKPRQRKAAAQHPSAAKGGKPAKPYPDFPLSPHPSGAWQKKIRGKIHYFGRWGRVRNGKMERVEGDGWEAALEQYKAVADDLHAGRTPRVKSAGLTVADLCNRFLTAKLRQREAGEIGARMFGEYRSSTDRLVAAFGKARLVDDLAADDFEALRAGMAEQWGPVRLCNEIQKVRTAFKYAYDSGLIDRPVRFGPQFRKPSAGVLRRHRASRGEKLFEAGEVRRLLGVANPRMKAMILLGVNCGFGNADVGTLPLSALDLDAGWVRYPRPKTGIERRCPLWPETVAALREALTSRTEPKSSADAGLVFVTKYGGRWHSGGTDNPLSAEVSKLLRAAGIDGRKGQNFYALRHTFRTVADGARDQPAADLIMGHTDPSMAAHYRERIEDGRLRAVADHVRQWLFGEAPDGGIPGEPDSTTPETSATCGPSDPLRPGGADARPTLRLYAG